MRVQGKDQGREPGAESAEMQKETKSEIRSSKSETNLKFQCSNDRNNGIFGLGFNQITY